MPLMFLLLLLFFGFSSVSSSSEVCTFVLIPAGFMKTNQKASPAPWPVAPWPVARGSHAPISRHVHAACCRVSPLAPLLQLRLGLTPRPLLVKSGPQRVGGPEHRSRSRAELEASLWRRLPLCPRRGPQDACLGGCGGQGGDGVPRPVTSHPCQCLCLGGHRETASPPACEASTVPPPASRWRRDSSVSKHPCLLTVIG